MTITASFIERPTTTGEDDGHASGQEEVPIGHFEPKIAQTLRFSVTLTWSSVESQVSAVGVCDWGSTDGNGRRTSGRGRVLFGPGLKRWISGWPGTYKEEHPVGIVRSRVDRTHFDGFTDRPP